MAMAVAVTVPIWVILQWLPSCFKGCFWLQQLSMHPNTCNVSNEWYLFILLEVLMRKWVSIPWRGQVTTWHGDIWALLASLWYFAVQDHTRLSKSTAALVEELACYSHHPTHLRHIELTAIHHTQSLPASPAHALTLYAVRKRGHAQNSVCPLFACG